MPNRAQLPPPPGAAAPGVSNSDPTRCRRARSTSLDPRKAMGHVPAHKYEPKPTAQTPRIAGDGRVCARALHTLRGARRQAGRRRLPPFSFFSKLRDDSTPSLILLDCTKCSTAHYVVEYLSIPRSEVLLCTLLCRTRLSTPEASESRPWAAAALHPHDRPAR